MRICVNFFILAYFGKWSVIKGYVVKLSRSEWDKMKEPAPEQAPLMIVEVLKQVWFGLKFLALWT